MDWNSPGVKPLRAGLVIQIYPDSERERKFQRRLFTSSMKRKIGHLHVLVVQWRQRNAKLLFFFLDLSLSWRPHCRRGRGILRSLIFG